MHFKSEEVMKLSNRFPIRTGLVLLLVFACSRATEPKTVRFENHALELYLDVSHHMARIADRGTMTVQPGWNRFRLHSEAEIATFALQDSPVEYEIDIPSPGLAENAGMQWILFRFDSEGPIPFVLEYTARFYEDVRSTRFSRERVGQEITGTITAEGAYLSPAAAFYPQGEDSLMRFTLTADIPALWESICDGDRLSSTITGERKIQTWGNPYPVDGITFMAGPFRVRSTQVDNIEVACYFFAEDTSLFDTYLPATADYIRMYTDLIGPYPFQRFTVVENFFPTGYGMPAWTLLGREVLRLPFIVYTSLGHEVLHNWWGNSVYVDDGRGNWCEAATVYGADYRYKLLRSPEAARDYRKDILKQYISYITESNDFPIRQFTTRSSPGTRTIGYNKAMMVYHMIEEEIGTEAFFTTWRRVYQRYRGQPISWEEWIAAFEEVSGRSLAHIIPQWIDQAGAPVLGLEIGEVTRHPADRTMTVDFRLQETSGRTYRLRVPLRFIGENTVLDTNVVIESPGAEFRLTVPDDVTTMAVDPDFHLFRKLYPEEIEPIISAILGNPDPRFIHYGESGADDPRLQAFAENLTETEASWVAPGELPNLPRTAAPIIVNPPVVPAYFSRWVSLEDDTLVIQGNPYPRAGHTVVLAGQSWEGFERYLVVLTSDPESLPRLGQLVPHYGKYSYLVFDGTRNVAKGQWPVYASPLRQPLFSGDASPR
jgi:hypothetical protein